MSLAEISNYSDLHAALRKRADDMQVSRETLDHLCGLPAGYAGKLLAPNPLKLVGPTSLGTLLEVMGCKLLLVEDPEAQKRLRHRLKKRAEHQVRPNGSIAARYWLFSRENAREISALVRVKMSPAARSLRARRAAIARWHKPE